MSEYWIDKDSNGDETLWRDDGRIFEPVNAEPVIRRCDLGDSADLLWPILTGVLIGDVATTGRLAAAVTEEYRQLYDLTMCHGDAEDLARAALRALREVSS